MSKWKIVPDTTLLVRKGRVYKDAPVLQYIAWGKNSHPASCPLRSDCVALELITAFGSRWHGFEDARIGPDLRMHVCLLENQERDEVIAKWEDSDFFPL